MDALLVFFTLVIFIGQKISWWLGSSTTWCSEVNFQLYRPTLDWPMCAFGPSSAEISSARRRRRLLLLHLKRKRRPQRRQQRPPPWLTPQPACGGGTSALPIIIQMKRYNFLAQIKSVFLRSDYSFSPGRLPPSPRP